MIESHSIRFRRYMGHTESLSLSNFPFSSSHRRSIYKHIYIYVYVNIYICIYPPIIHYPCLLLQIMKGVMKLFLRRSCSRGSFNEVSITSEDPGKENSRQSKHGLKGHVKHVATSLLCSRKSKLASVDILGE